MTEEELVGQVTKQAGTIDEQSKKLTEQADVIAKLTESASASSGKTAEEIKALEDRATVGDEAVKKVAEMQGAADQATLEKEYPAIKDWTAIVGDTLEAKREHAGKIIAMIPGAKAPEKDESGKIIVPAVEPKPADSGEAFKDAPASGGGNLDAAAKLAYDKTVTELKEATKKGDIATVLEKTMELQPKATSALFSNA